MHFGGQKEIGKTLDPPSPLLPSKLFPITKRNKQQREKRFILWYTFPEGFTLPQPPQRLRANVVDRRSSILVLCIGVCMLLPVCVVTTPFGALFRFCFFLPPLSTIIPIFQRLVEKEENKDCFCGAVKLPHILPQETPFANVIFARARTHARALCGTAYVKNVLCFGISKKFSPRNLIKIFFTKIETTKRSEENLIKKYFCVKFDYN